MSQRPGFEARNFFDFLPPVVAAAGTGITVLATSAALVVVDLTSLPGHQVNAALDQSNDQWNPNPLGRYLYVQADTVDAFIAFGPTAASLAALSATAVSTVAANKVTQVAGGCIRVPASASPGWMRFQLPGDFNTRDNVDKGASSLARFLGFISASAGFIRLYQCGP